MIKGERYRRAYVQVDMDAIRHNFKTIKEHTRAKICCVVKANAYGHGAVELSNVYEEMGADFLAVSNIEEALQLRNSQISLPILILGYTPAECAAILARNDISQCVYSQEYALALHACAEKAQVHIKIHIKLDTGMGRIGFLCRDKQHNELDKALYVAKMPNFITEGVFTHCAVSDEGIDGTQFTRQQFECFMNGVKYLESHGVRFLVRHFANSAAIFEYPEMHLDMVRAGIVLYGLKPSEKVKNLSDLHGAMSFKSVVSNVKNLYAGESVSYGRTFIAERDMKIATVPVGYADGFWRNNGENAYSFIINGRDAPIIGRVCMDQVMVDVSEIECSIGDTVIIWDCSSKHTIDDLARLNHTINYEVVCAIGERVPRVYMSDGHVNKWDSRLLT